MAAEPSRPNSYGEISTMSGAIYLRARETPDAAALVFRSASGDSSSATAAYNNSNDNNSGSGGLGDSAAPVVTRRVLTYGDLYRLGGRWAGELRHRRVGRGSLVTNALLNSPERAVVEAAILLSGAASVNCVCLLSDGSDLKATLRKSGACAVVIDPDVMPNAYRALLSDVTPERREGGDEFAVTSESLPDLRYVFPVRRRRSEDEDEDENDENDQEKKRDFLTSLRAGAASAATNARNDENEVYFDDTVSEDDLCTVFTTSGSTGFSKLVEFTHGTLVSLAKSFKQPTASVHFSSAKMGWIGGYVGLYLVSGGTRVILDERAGAPDDPVSCIYDVMKEEGVTTGHIPVDVLPELAAKVTEENGGKPLLAVMGLGTQPITRRIVDAASKIGRALVVTYGMTEVSCVSAAVGVDPATFQDFCMGGVVPGAEVKVVNEEGREVEAGTRGELLVKSRFAFRGYLNDPEATRDARTSDGFFRTGDTGWFDGSGRLFVEGRSKDAIMRGSFVFYPSWMENRIASCPAVRDVMVVGVPDAKFGSELCACVVLNDSRCCSAETPASVDDVKTFVESDLTAINADAALTPRPRHYLVFDSFPHTCTDKPNRREVGRIAAERLQDCER